LNIEFFYLKNIRLPKHELVAKNLCEYTNKVISIPNNISIEFVPLKDHVYGETILTENRFRINDSLSDKEIIKPVIHELIHLHQKHMGKLKVMRDGTFIWNGKQYRKENIYLISQKEYENLPWEQDVNRKIDNILSTVVELFFKDKSNEKT
jgi:hypothetical protein